MKTAEVKKSSASLRYSGSSLFFKKNNSNDFFRGNDSALKPFFNNTIQTKTYKGSATTNEISSSYKKISSVSDIQLQQKPTNASKCIKDVNKCKTKCVNQKTVKQSIINAKKIVTSTLNRMSKGPLSIPIDERAHSQMHTAYILFFKVVPGFQSTSQIVKIKDNFRKISDTLKSVSPYCVTKDCCDCQSGEMLHDAFVIDSSIYLCPAFFNKSDDQQARDIIHEVAHAKLKVGHAGNRFLLWGCPEIPLKSFDDAINNAYAYDHFAYCVSKLPKVKTSK